jgi:hypothetical protein
MPVDRTFLSPAHRVLSGSGVFDDRWYARLERIVKDLRTLEDADTVLVASDAALDVRLDVIEARDTTAYSVPAGAYTVNHLRRLQFMTNSGGRTITAPTTDCTADLLITNSASAGALTWSGFLSTTQGVGDAFTTTNGHRHLVRIVRINGASTYVNRRVL